MNGPASRFCQRFKISVLSAYTTKHLVAAKATDGKSESQPVEQIVGLHGPIRVDFVFGTGTDLKIIIRRAIDGHSRLFTSLPAEAPVLVSPHQSPREVTGNPMVDQGIDAGCILISGIACRCQAQLHRLRRD